VSVVSAGSKFTYVAPNPCDGQVAPSRVVANLTTPAGARIKVDLRRSSVLPGLPGVWSGNVDLVASSPSGRVDVRGPVLTSAQVVVADAGTCGAVRITVPGIDVGRFPWRFSNLSVRLVPGAAGAAPQVEASFLDAAVPLGPALGRLTIS
jgi:hypothetical protein